MSIDEDANGIVDTICNEFSLTVRQVVEEYGLDKCSEQVQKLYKDGKYQEKYPSFMLLCQDLWQNRKRGVILIKARK